MKVARLKLTKRITETQFGEDKEVLFRNAKISHPGQEIEVIDMTQQEFENQIDIQNYNDLSQEQKDEIKIRQEMLKINREQAIINLRAKGEIE